MIYSAVLISGVQQSEPVMHTHISTFFKDSFPIQGITECWVEFPVLYNRSLIVIRFIYSNVYMSIPVSQFTPPPLSSLVTVSWFPGAHGLIKQMEFCSTLAGGKLFSCLLQGLSWACQAELLGLYFPPLLEGCSCLPPPFFPVHLTASSSTWKSAGAVSEKGHHLVISWLPVTWCQVSALLSGVMLK